MKELLRLAQHYKKYIAKKNRQHLDYLLSNASEVQSYDEMIEWLEELVRWLREESKIVTPESTKDASGISALRIRYLLQVLNRNEEWKKSVRRILTSLVGSSISLEFFSEVGLSFHNHFVPELIKRITESFLPEGSASGDFIATLRKIFDSEQDSVWIELIDEESLKEISTYFYDLDKYFHDSVKTHLENAIYLLGGKIHGDGISSQIRNKLSSSSFRSNPFFLLYESVRFLINPTTPDLLQENYQHFQLNLQNCKTAIVSISDSLDHEGVRVDTVYNLDLMSKRLDRIDLLAKIYTQTEGQADHYKTLMIGMIADVHHARSIGAFFNTNLNLLLKKIVQRNSEIGTHYMAASLSQYLSIFEKALGGGALTAVTVMIKIFITKTGVTGFVLGFLASLNYAASFLTIQFMHFTLATKQPASTAPALARELSQGIQTGEFDDFLMKIASVLRAQFASVFGNIIAVIPIAFFFSMVFNFLSGHPLMDPAKATATLQSLSLLGPSAFYAALTGFLLFASSIAAGWIDNWFVLNKISFRVSTNKFVVSALGQKAAEDFGKALKQNVAGIAGNITLGFILGLLPELFKFLGVPLDVRHVTLSMGSIFAAVPTFGLDFIFNPDFLLAFVGAFVIGLFNVYFSFFFALGMAVKAENLGPAKRSYITKSVFYLIFKKPWLVLLPPKKKANP